MRSCHQQRMKGSLLASSSLDRAQSSALMIKRIHMRV